MSDRHQFIRISAEGYSFTLAEIRAVHAQCDRLGIAFESPDGERLSMAQRVKLLADHALRCEEAMIEWDHG